MMADWKNGRQLFQAPPALQLSRGASSRFGVEDRGQRHVEAELHRWAATLKRRAPLMRTDIV